MQTKEDLIQQYKSTFPNRSDEEIEKYATMMSEKYSTIKRGDNVVHLDYYEGLITTSEITDIENSLKEYNLELSRFDKNGVPYAYIEDFNLHLAIFLSDPVVQNILLGLGTNGLWDTIKKTAFFVWTKVKQRHWDNPAEQGRKANLNFGLKVKLDKNTGFDLKLDGDLSEELVLEALDKTIELLKSTDKKDSPKKADFYKFDKQTKEWTKVDIMAEMRKKYEQQV
jgi:hypothetical protein